MWLIKQTLRFRPIVLTLAGATLACSGAVSTDGTNDRGTSGGDTQAPSVSISTPSSSGSFGASENTVSLAGTASDNVGVTQITWSNDRGGSGTATGTAAWATGTITLQPGANVIMVMSKDAANNMGTATITITYSAPAAVPTQLTITTQPSASVISGGAFAQQPVIQLRDASSNALAQAGIVVTASIASGGGSLGGVVTATTNTSGVATFSNLSITGADGARTLTFSANGLTSATSGPTVVTAAPETQAPTVSITSPSSNGSYSTSSNTVTVAGSAGDNVGIAQIAWSNSSGGSGTATGTTSWLAANIALQSGANVITITVRDAANNSATATLTVTYTPPPPPSATQLAITTQPSVSAQSGATFGQQPVIQLRDASNGAVAQAGVVVTASIASGAGTLGGTLTATTNASGAATFTNLAIAGANGDRTLSFAATGLTSTTSSTITISAAPDAQAPTVAITVPASSGSAATSVATVTVGGTASDNVGVTQVTWSNDRGGSATATGTTSWSAANIALQSGANVITVTAKDAANNSATATITVTYTAPVVATKLSITTQPSVSAQSGAAFAQQPVIQLRDASNTAVAQAGVVVTASIASGAGTLGGTLTATTNASGAATFTNLAITGANGDRTLSFAATGLTSATSSAITISAPPDAQAPTVAITAPSSSGSAPTSVGTVTVGGTASDNVGVTQVTWSNNRGGTGTATGTTTWTAAGIALLSGANIITVTAKDAANNSATATITVTYTPPAVATKLSITTEPSAAAQGGVAFAQQPVIQLRDASNNAVAQSGVVVTATIATGGGTLGGTLTATTNASGAASFMSLSITGADGARTLTFAAATLTSATSTSIAVTTSGGSSPTVLFSENWEQASFESRGWYDDALTSISTVEHAPAGAGAKSLEMRFTSGNSMPTGASGRHLFTPSNSVYMEYWIKHSSNWVGTGETYGPHLFHFLTNEDDQYIGPAATHLTTYIEEWWLSSGAVAVLETQDALNIDATRLNQDLTNVTENRSTAGCNGESDGTATICYMNGSSWNNGKTWQSSGAIFTNSAGTKYKSDWHKVGIYFKLNSIVGGKGQLDGVAQYWVDDQLVIDRHNVLFRTGAHASMQFNQFAMLPYMGDGSPVQQSLFIDDLVVMTAPPAGLAGASFSRTR